MDDLEKTLNELALAMQDHRDVLASKGVSKASPSPRRTMPDDARAALEAADGARADARGGDLDGVLVDRGGQRDRGGWAQAVLARLGTAAAREGDRDGDQDEPAHGCER